MGVTVIRAYKIAHDKTYVENTLIKLQYDYPEIRILESDQWLFGEFDEPYRRINGIVDTSYLLQKYKDYFHLWNGDKVFLYSADNGNTIYKIRVLDALSDRCKLGILTISVKIGDNRKWFSYRDRNKSEVRNELKLFEDTILPKLQKELGEMKICF